MSLANIRQKAKLKPPIMVLYGPGGIGKTSFAATMNKTIIIVQAEDGIGKIECTHFPVAKTYNEFEDNLKALIDEKSEYKTVCIDSLDWLETLMHEHVCAKNSWPDISSPAYGKGYAVTLRGMERIFSFVKSLANKRFYHLADCT